MSRLYSTVSVFVKRLFKRIDKVTLHDIDKERKFWNDVYKHQDELWNHANTTVGKAPNVSDLGGGL